MYVTLLPGLGPLPGDPLRYYAGVAPVAAVMALGAWYHTRRTILAINRVAIAESGLYPPFKPKQRLSKQDWFVPYKDIVSMVPVAEKGGFVPAYDVTLRDGLTFQLNALDLLVYVDEKEVRRYAKLLAVIKEEIDRPENRARAERGEDILIPAERFKPILAKSSGPEAPAARPMFWYFVAIGAVAGFLAALIIGFAILR